MSVVPKTHAWWMPGWLDRIVPDLQLEGGGASEYGPDKLPPGGSPPVMRA
jgi:hypothetical protein